MQSPYNQAGRFYTIMNDRLFWRMDTMENILGDGHHDGEQWFFEEKYKRRVELIITIELLLIH